MVTKVVILGGGISGLAAAWYLKKRQGDAVDITILEKGSRLGGWIHTVQRDGFLFELGPRSCRASGSGLDTLRLVEELGLQGQVITAAPAARRRYLYTQGRLQPLPTGFLSFLTSPLTRPLLWPLLREWRVPPSQVSDESIYDFVERRLGSYAADTLVDPLVSGIFAGDPKKLSLQSCFPLLHQWEQERGSIVRGMLSRNKQSQKNLSPFVQSIRKEGLFSFRLGMQQLIDTLASRLHAEIRLGCEVASLQDSGDGFRITTVAGDTFIADRVISALPSMSLAKLHPSLTALLEGIPFTSVAVVSIGYDHRVLPQEGFGYLIPSRERQKLLGVVWDSSAFPQHNADAEETRVTCMLGGEHMDNFSSYRSEDFRSMALEGLQRHLGISAEPATASVTIARHAIPQYTCGHGARVVTLRAQVADLLPNLTVVGNSFDGVSVNDCIAEACDLR